MSATDASPTSPPDSASNADFRVADLGDRRSRSGVRSAVRQGIWAGAGRRRGRLMGVDFAVTV